MASAILPSVPAPHTQLVKYLSEHPNNPIPELLEPYRKYEAELRSVFAQDRHNPALDDPTINLLPLFNEDTKLITTRARDLASESPEEKAKYIMPLPDEKRRPHDSPAVVADIKEFQKNFSIFSESSLADMDWSNVVAAGSSVVNCLLPVPENYKSNKRKLREYYHQIFCPASDVDLFLYGLTHEQAVEKIKQIEQAIRDAILHEVTVVRTKYAITIASQYPTRHIQIVLRVYKSVGEILTGFDIDAAGGAYDGKQVYVTPRALGSFITQINHIDLTRRSPSYENRLSKYSRRAFEIYWPDLDRSRIDPTIFERSFSRSLGLARLIVMEHLPTSSAREEYVKKRRQERGRPAYHSSFRPGMGGNIKDSYEDEVADWVNEADVSNYHTFTVPYGENFHAKKIEKLCYTRDLLLNAEWNQHKDRAVYLHRHPAFFGRVEDVIEDCCGYCPEPATDEEKDVAEKEAEIYISGKVGFLIDDPGRQQIGSFNPLTANDWTDMAYVGNTARLCQCIVDGDLDGVRDWLSQGEANLNKRDYTGRTPLQLAVQCSTLEIVKALVDAGARLTARILDGRTALHLAAARGETEMIKIILDKSNANEEAEEEKQDLRRRARNANSQSQPSATPKSPVEKDNDVDMDQDSDGDEDIELVDLTVTSDQMSTATGSFVKIDAKELVNQEAALDGAVDEPDFYKIDILAWDVPCSPLHLAIVNGHEEAVTVLCDYGADSLLPIKFLDSEKNPTAAILTLVLSLCLPPERAKSMALLLLKLGSTCSQADMDGCTAFHRFVEHGKPELVGLLTENDKTGVMAAVKAIVWNNYHSAGPLNTALCQGDAILALRVLEAGTKPNIDFETWLKAAKLAKNCVLFDHETNQRSYRDSVVQPLLDAVLHCPDPELVKELLARGADPNTMASQSWNKLHLEHYRTNDYCTGETVLDIVRAQIRELRRYKGEGRRSKKPLMPRDIDTYADKYAEGSWARWNVERHIEETKDMFKSELRDYRRTRKAQSKQDGLVRKIEAINEVLEDYIKIEQLLTDAGAKTFYSLDTTLQKPKLANNRHRRYSGHHAGYSRATYWEGKPFEYIFSVPGVDDITDIRRDGYIKVFEAAWSGDIETIKSYTLGAWGKNGTQPPLRISVSDSKQNSPFSLAFLNGHHDVARGILDIVEAQFEREDKLAYKIKASDNDEDDSDDCSDADSARAQDADDDIRIVSHKVGEKKFTIDNIAEVFATVKSRVRPMEVLLGSFLCFEVVGGKPSTDYKHGLSRTDLFSFAVTIRDQKSLNFLIDLGLHFSKPEHGGEVDAELGPVFNFPVDAFKAAAREGPVPILTDIIRRTGAGIPLDYLVRKSGVEIKEKPKSYQGLTVYGKKRKDWANAGRNLVVRSTCSKTPPLLDVAEFGNIDMIEWWLSDAPHRYYIEFNQSEQAKNDKRLKHLGEAVGGFDSAITKWLGVQNDLIIHCAVMGSSNEEGVTVLKRLLDTHPELIETKSTSGETPFFLACLAGRLKFATILVQAGADQLTRNHEGSNVIHAALTRVPDAASLRRFLEILDPSARSHLLTQRNNLGVSGTTPLHTWLAAELSRKKRDPDKEKEQLDILRVLLEYSGGAEVGMLNGAGDTLLHTAVMRHSKGFVQALVEYRPDLLLRENAVGRTPVEVSQDFVTANKFKQPNKLRSGNNSAMTDDLCTRDPKLFVDEDGSKKAKKEWYKTENRNYYYHQANALATSCPEVLEICERFLEQLRTSPNAAKRRLVSLNEANDVARRLGEQYKGADKNINLQRRNDDYDNMPDEERKSEGDDESKDYVERERSWMYTLTWPRDTAPGEDEAEDEDEEDEDIEDDSEEGEGEEEYDEDDVSDEY